MMRDLISVVTPTFKQPEWVRLCANSVSDQEGVDVEHIIQDAGDGKGLEGLGERTKAKIFVEKDNGMYDGLTKGIAKTSGAIISHLNSDEQYLPGVLKMVSNFFETHPDVDVLYGDAILANADGYPLSYRRILVPLRAHTRTCHLSTLTCSTFFRRSLVDRGLSYSSAWKQIADAMLVLKWLDAGIKMAVIHRPFAVFTFTGANMNTGEEARMEGALWDKELGLWRFQRPLLSAHHRLRKLVNGAYQARDVELRIYTRKSPNERQTIRVNRLGFRWPRAS
jgi:glycosyltransferase involved in cell wall biosynthesis